MLLLCITEMYLHSYHKKYLCNYSMSIIPLVFIFHSIIPRLVFTPIEDIFIRISIFTTHSFKKLSEVSIIRSFLKL